LLELKNAGPMADHRLEMTARRAVLVFLTFLGALGTTALAFIGFLIANLCTGDDNEPGYVCEHPSATTTVLWNVACFALPPLVALGCGIWASKTERWTPMIGVLAAPLAIVLLSGPLEP
jgi:hypothetical protein